MVNGMVRPLTLRQKVLVVTALSVVGVVMASALGLLGGLFWGFDLFSHYRLQYAGLLALAAVAAAALRSWIVAGPTAALLLLHLLPIAPLILPASQPDGEGSTLRLVQYNVQIGNNRTDDGAAWLRSQDADVIIIQEADQTWAAALDDGLPGMRRLPTPTLRTDSFGMAVYIDDELSVVSVEAVTDWNNPVIIVELDVDRADGAPMLVYAMHPPPPLTGSHVDLADRQMDRAAARMADPGRSRVIVGDLNATRWSASLRRLLDQTGLRHSSEGSGLSGTWPSMLWFTGMITIDHVLVSDDIRVDRYDTGPGFGSDHLPVVVDLTITS